MLFHQIAALVLALLLVGCSAKRLTPVERLAVFANAACTMLDITSTELALLHGFREGNPMLVEREIRIPWLVLSSVAFWFIGEAFEQRTFWNSSKAAMHCAASGWNLNNVRKGTKQGDSF
jgi:hypothetical protein